MIYLKKVISLSSSSITFSQDASVQSSSIKNSSELLLHPRPNELQFSFPVYEGAQAVIPSLFISRTQLYGNDIFNVRFPMKTIMGDHVEVNMLLPPSEVNPDIPMNSIEDQSLLLAEKRGIYEGHKFRDLSDAFFSGLVGVVYPSFDASRGLRATVHLDNLFAVDDMYSEDILFSLEKWSSNFEEQMRIISVIHDLSDDQEEIDYVLRLKDSKKYSNLIYAYIDEFVEQKKLLKQIKMDTESFLSTLFSYFKSVVWVKMFEANKIYPNEEQGTEIRADASGAIHAVMMGASFYNINVSQLESKYYELKHMKTYTARCVEYSNDIYSLYKEHIVMQKSLSEDDGIHEIRGKISFNIVQILWQASEDCSLKNAILNAALKHNNSLKNYYQIKSVVLKDMERRRVIAETKKDDFDIEQLTQDFEQIKTYCKIMEGWLAHGWWALSVPRYNLGVTPCSQERLLELQTLQKELLHVDDTGH